jgi:PAS domain S-box-containing protein
MTGIELTEDKQSSEELAGSGAADSTSGWLQKPEQPARIGQPRQRLLRFWLVSSLLACVLPVWLTVGLFGYRAYQQKRSLVEQRLLERARALSVLVDRELAAMQASATALATSPSLASGDFAAFHHQALAVLQGYPGGNISLSDATAQQLVNTFVPFGTPLPKRGNSEGVQEIFETGKPIITNLYKGALTGRPVVGIEIPVIHNGRVVYDLALTVPASHFSSIFSQQRVPEDWPTSILDANRVVVGRNHLAESSVGLPTISPVFKGLGETAEGVRESKSREGVLTFAYFSRSPITGWAVSIGIPRAVILAEIRQWLWWMVGGAIALSIMGIVLALFLARRIARSIQALIAPALALGTGEPVDVQPLDLVETNKVAQSLLKASQLLQQRTAEREQAEQTLRASEERWSTTLRSIGDAVLTIDTSGRVTFLNPVAAALTGWQPEEAQGQPIQRVFPIINEQTRAAAEDIVGRVLKEKHIVELANHSALISKAGREIPIEDSAAPILDITGEVVGVVLVFHDVTEKRHKEEQRQRLTRALKALNDSNQVLLRATDEAALLEQVCQIVTEGCGHAMVWIGFAEEDEAKSVRPVAYSGFEEGYLETLGITWADTARGRGPTGTAIRTGQPCSCRNMLTDPKFQPWRAEALKRGYASSLVLPIMEDGKAFGAITIYSRHPDAFSEDEVKLLLELTNDLAYGISTLRVRAAREKAEEALRRQADLLRLSFDAIIVWRIGGGIESWNRGAEQLYGYSESEALGHVAHELLRTIHPVPWSEIEPRLRESGQWEGELRDFTRDGREVIVSARKQLFLGADGIERVLETNRDITERKRAEQALLRSEKLASVGRMAASIAHEINNPLEAVTNLLFLARSGGQDATSARQYLDMADDELKRVSHITRQTLGFYRESSAPTKVSVASVIDSALDLLRGKIKVKRAIIEKQYGGDLQVAGVAGELRQVFSNLLANSLDAINEEGTIKLRVSTRTAFNNGQRYIRITIADDGKGINAATLPRIFEPLFTTKESTGSGLGLWVSKQIIEKHYGSIHVRSRTHGELRGAVFSIVLPTETAIATRSQSAGA